MENICALCGTQTSEEYITSDRSGGKKICTDCVDELDAKRGIIRGDLRAVKKGVVKVGKATQKGVQTFKEELSKDQS